MKPQAMTIKNVRYVEIQSRDTKHEHGPCSQCALYQDFDACREATIGDAGRKAFGGDCIQRDVVYAREQGA